jgi:hypothetical protein
MAGSASPRAAALTALLLLPLACASAPARTGASAEVYALTGAPTRAVWVQGDGSDPFASGRNLVLMGLDTEDGRGERVVLGEPGSYVKPLITPAGTRVVYSTHPLQGDPSVYVVNFDGTGRRRIDSGFGLGVWADPGDGSEWVDVGTDAREYSVGAVVRVRIDRPEQRRTVWSAARVQLDSFQVSPDGRLAGGQFPWPRAGVADLTAGTWCQLGEGCWTALQDVGSPLFWYFDGAHRNLLLVDVTTDRRWTVPINHAPGFRNPEVYHPRWTNHPRFLAMTGPYDQGGANQVRSGGNQSEVWLGRFTADFTAVEAWARVSRNGRGDSYPDVWIEPGDGALPRMASGRVGPGARTVVDAERAVVEARLVTAGAIPDPQAILPYRHALVVSVYEVTRLLEGQYDGGPLLVAQWAIRDGRVLADAARPAGQQARLTIERFAAHPELEGERLVQGPDLPDRPLFYDAGAPATR